MGTELNGLYRLTKKDVKRAAVVLGKAFTPEPLTTHFFPEEKRFAAAEAYSAIGLYLGTRFGEVYAPTENIEAAAAWLRPGTAPFTGWQMLRAVPFLTLLRFGRNGAARLRAMGDYVDEMHKKLVPQPHWYLQIIGVDPEHQGMGYFSRLMRPMLAWTDGEGLPCYLETLTERNVSIYKRFGFKVVHEGSPPGTDLPVVCLLREPGGASE